MKSAIKRASELEKKIKAVLAAGQVILMSGNYGFLRSADRKACGCALFVAATAVGDVNPVDFCRDGSLPVDVQTLRDWLILEGFEESDVLQLEMGFEYLRSIYGTSGCLILVEPYDPFYVLGKKLREENVTY